MAPASTAGARQAGRSGRASREEKRNYIIERIRRWVELYGEPPVAADWNPSSARWSDQLWRVERYRQGDPNTAEPWPSLNAAKAPFDGKFTEAIRAAGFEPPKPGPRRRADVVRQVDVERLEMHPDARVALEAARAEARAAQERIATRDRQLAKVREHAERLAGELEVSRRENARLRRRADRPSPTKTKVVRERVVDERAARRADARVERAEQAAAAARERAAEARTTASRLAARLERAEATVTTVRGERRELVDARDRAEDRAVAAERQVAALRDQLEALRARPPVVLSADRAAVEAAQREARDAEKRAEAAELRAARAERKEREVAAAIAGEARTLTAAELKQLRERGPAGPAMLARALEDLAGARRRGGRMGLDAALRRVAATAETWRARL